MLNLIQHLVGLTSINKGYSNKNPAYRSDPEPLKESHS